MTFTILTDSSSNLPESLIDAHNLKILPLEFTVEEQVYYSYLKGSVTDITQFYTMMREGKVITTSLPKFEDVNAIIREEFEAGNDVLYLGFDSALSGTYEHCSSFIERIRDEEYPDCKLECVDTKAAALGQGLFVLSAAKVREEGKSLAETAEWARANTLSFAHWFTVDDLSYLQRGGRLSKGVAVAGSLLNIKPILHVDEIGRLVPMDKVRGRRKSLQMLVEKFAQGASEPKSKQLVCISHGDCLEDAEFVAAQFSERFGVSDFVINCLDPVIGAHVGPGTIALFFVTDKER
ncbi:MAG: DegV family protein [Coriobacteriales bacterium]|jgi:DegV family protein with EDD domain|nr:DegV family protein [Coriobacteriales bacterium]